MRKVLIGFVSLGCVLAAYLLYTGVSDSPVIEDNTAAEFSEAVADSNIGDFDSNVGRIGNVGIGTTKKAYFIEVNEETRVLEREWGFETLLSKSRGIWELEEPYVNVFERDFRCYITADTGRARMETAAERSTPRDATFSGNVVIHVVPNESSDMKESFVYLDDVVFLSERSQLSTKGPVEYVSEDVHMQGRGLELVFNDQSDRLEYFRIFDLETLRLKNAPTEMFSDYQQAADESAEVETPAETQQADVVAVAADTEKAEESAGNAALVDRTPEGVYYKCILSKNVLIDTPNELIFADQRILITDIFLPKDSLSSDASDANDTEAVAVAAEDVPPDDSNSVSAEGGVDPNSTVAAAVESKASPEEPNDIVITCANGIVFVPMDTNRSLDEFMQVAAGSESERPEVLETDSNRTKLLAPRIDYNAVTGNVAADGESRLTLFSRDRTGADANEPLAPTKVTARDGVNFFQASNQVVFTGDCLGSMPQKGLTEPRDVTFQSPKITVNLPQDKNAQPDVLAAGPATLVFYMQDTNDIGAAPDPNALQKPNEPTAVTVTAQKEARFSGSANQIVFVDDCRCLTTREDPNEVTEYELRSELITVDLPEDTNAPEADSSGSMGGIEHLTASGGVVRLASTKRAKADPNLVEYTRDVNDTELLGGVEIKCARVDFDPNEGLFKASGEPAEIWMDNSKVAVSDHDPNGFSLSGPCYAFLANYDSLKYFINEDRIVAEAVPGGALWFHYVPVVDGVHNPDAMTTASAPRVEAFLKKLPDGRTELSTLKATGGIDINDLSNGNHFIGSELHYDQTTSIMKINGDETRPCLGNGLLVDGIEYNVTTGKLDFKVVGPGAMQTNQQ
jgi:hypothetical protein